MSVHIVKQQTTYPESEVAMQIVHQYIRTKSLPVSLESVLPYRLLDAVKQINAPSIEELRLHAERLATVTSNGKSHSTGIKLSEEELAAILKKMCADSLYAFGDHIRQGYITMEGGVRVGVGGRASVEHGCVIGVQPITSLIIRIPHSISLNTDDPLSWMLSDGQTKSLLVYAPPCGGKTTLLRALTRRISSAELGIRTVLVDTREELCFDLDDEMLSLTILKGYPRALGIEIAIRNMGAELIVCDEIGNEDDASALLLAANSGVAILASAHAISLDGLLRRPSIYRLHQAAVFDTYLGITRERTQLRYTAHTLSSL